MAETKYVCVPVEPTREMIEGARQCLSGEFPVSGAMERGSFAAEWESALAAAPQSHVAVPREFLECVCHALEMEGATTFGWEGEDENFNDLAAELRSLLAKE